MGEYARPKIDLISSDPIERFRFNDVVCIRYPQFSNDFQDERTNESSLEDAKQHRVDMISAGFYIRWDDKGNRIRDNKIHISFHYPPAAIREIYYFSKDEAIRLRDILNEAIDRFDDSVV